MLRRGLKRPPPSKEKLNIFCDRYCYYVFGLLILLLYLKGFFPLPPRAPRNYPPNTVTALRPPYRKAVLVVIDALRLDFISETTTPFIAHDARSSGCFSRVKVETPTVTLPRIKALTTGAVPQFVDVVLNLASAARLPDSLVHRAYAQGRRLVFYGDAVWLQLFPEEFIRSEGTSSFFVTDYTEVDDNVTRNVHLEAARGDWDLMILHYLGLDHIGHVHGPRSPLVPAKLREMDRVVEEIRLANKGALVVVTGDHGMREGGGHGGATFHETHVPFVVLGAPCRNGTFAQVDIAANLALLLGLDVPPTSIGQLQESLLTQLSQDEYLQALKYNADLLKTKQTCPDFESDWSDNLGAAERLFEAYTRDGDLEAGLNASRIYKEYSKAVSEKLQNESTQTDGYYLFSSFCIGVYIILRLIHSYSGIDVHDTASLMLLAPPLLMGLLIWSPENSFGICYLLLMQFILYIMFVFDPDLLVIEWSFWAYACVLHPFIFLSSSFLEEEHQFWYFFAGTFFVYNIVVGREKAKWVMVFVALRFVRTINQVGDQWAGAPDLSDWLLEEQNRPFLVGLFVVALALTFCANVAFRRDFTVFVLDLPVLVGVFVYRVVAAEAPEVGQALWGLILLKLVVIVVRKHAFLPVWTLASALLLKPHNVVLIPLAAFASRLFHRTLPRSPNVLAHFALGSVLFFAQGHDNSLSSVDVSAGYVGLSDYSAPLVFTQVLCHTFAMPVLARLLLFAEGGLRYRTTFPTFFGLRLYVCLVTFVVALVHRHHLFVWSVFAPKMLVELSHYAAMLIEVSFYYLRDEINKRLLWKAFYFSPRACRAAGRTAGASSP